MTNLEILNSDIIRARILNLEYENLSNRDIEREIRRIYIEETGKDIDGEIKIYKSDDIKDLKSTIDSGFDGTVVHIYSKSKGINQAYTITRGSEMTEKDTWKPLDWAYNLMGIFVGKNTSQYDNAKKFDILTTMMINESILKSHPDNKVPLKKIGMGHSLGGGLVGTLQLTKQRFDQVYVINDAPPSAYQLAVIDPLFARSLKETFKIDSNNFDQIYQIPPAELKAFTEEYYKNKLNTNSIHHLTAQEDMLYGVSGIRGFIDIGNRNVVDTMSEFEGIRNLIAKISDDDLKAIQVYLTQYSDAYNNGGFDGLVQEMSGLNIAMIEELSHSSFKDKILHGIDYYKDFKMMVKNMKQRIPVLIEKVGILYKNLDPILEAFVQVNFMTREDKDNVMSNIKGIENDLRDIKSSLNSTFSWTDLLFMNPIEFVRMEKKIFELVTTIEKKVTDIIQRFKNIDVYTEKLIKKLKRSVEAHGLINMVNALASTKGRCYEGSDLLLTYQSRNTTIKVNLSSAVRIYKKGLEIATEKERVLERIKHTYELEYIQDFGERKQKLLAAIQDMEGNPSKYQYLLGKFTYDAEEVYVLKSINVHEHIPPLEQSFINCFESLFSYYKQEIEKGRNLIIKIKQSFEQFFSEEKNLSKIFDLKY